MTVVPAQVAGVKNIVVVCPHPNAELRAAANFLGVKQIAQIGGAQAIAALAYGTATIPRVEKIFGPGNRYVTAAKQLVSSDCAIDLPAGPTEAIVLATHANANAKWIAADLLAQAEHAPDAGSFLVTTSRSLAQKVQREIAQPLLQLPKTNPAHALHRPDRRDPRRPIRKCSLRIRKSLRPRTPQPPQPFRIPPKKMHLHRHHLRQAPTPPNR